MDDGSTDVATGAGDILGHPRDIRLAREAFDLPKKMNGLVNMRGDRRMQEVEIRQLLAGRAPHDAPRASEPSPVKRPHVRKDEFAARLVIRRREPGVVVEADDAVALRHEPFRPPAEAAEQVDAEGPIVRSHYLSLLPLTGGEGEGTGNRHYVRNPEADSPTETARHGSCLGHGPLGSNGQRQEKASQSCISQDGYSGIGPHM